MRMPMPPACAHVCSNVSINASVYRFVHAYANAPAVYPNGAFRQPDAGLTLYAGNTSLLSSLSCRLSRSSLSYLPSLLILVSLLSPLPFQSYLSPLASDHFPVSSRLSLLSVESFANYHSLATIQYEW